MSTFKEDTVCTICLDTINRQDWIQLPCQHDFCDSCLKKHYKEHVVYPALECPLCRYIVSDPELIPTSWHSIEDVPNTNILSKLVVTKPHFKGHPTDKWKLAYLDEKVRTVIENSMTAAIKHGRHDVLEWWYQRYEFDAERITAFCHLAIRKNNMIALQILLSSLGSSTIRIEDESIKDCIKDITDAFFVHFIYDFEDISLPIFNFCYEMKIALSGKASIGLPPYIIAYWLSPLEDKQKLRWWKKRFPLYHFRDVFKLEKIEILKWWRKHSYLSYLQLDVEEVLDEVEDPQIMDWWMKNLRKDDIDILYTPDAIVKAVNNNNLPLLEWWSASGLPLKIDFKKCFHEVTSLPALEWLVKSAQPSDKTIIIRLLPDLMEQCSDQFSHRNHDFHDYEAIMNWCLDYHGEIRTRHADFYSCSNICLRNFSRHGAVHMLQWWKDQNLPMNHGLDAMNDASDFGHVDVLQWWKDSGLPLLYGTSALQNAIERQHEEVVDWWRNSGLSCRLEMDQCRQYYVSCHSTTMDRKRKLCDSLDVFRGQSVI